jgi:methyl-accepting chemotaxis protein PixJ
MSPTSNGSNSISSNGKSNIKQAVDVAAILNAASEDATLVVDESIATVAETPKPTLNEPPADKNRRSGFNFKSMSLKTKVAALAVALGTIPVVAIGSVTYYFASGALAEKVIKAEEAQVVEMADKVNRFMLDRFSEAQTFANLPIFANPKVSAITTTAEKEAVLTNLAKINRVYDSVAVFNLKGDLIAQSAGTRLANHSDRDYFQQVLKTGQAVIDQPQISKSTQQKVIYFAAPIKDTVTGNMIAIVRTRMPVKAVDEIVKNFGNNGNEYHLTDGSGTFFIDQEQSLVGRKAQENFPGLPQLTTQTKPETLTTVNKLDGAEQIVAYSPLQKLEGLPDLNWGAVIATDTQQAFSAQRVLLIELVIGTLLTTVIVGALGAYLANRGSRPILEASEAVQKLGQGDLDTRVTVTSEDELGVLGNNINLMAVQIQDLLVSQEQAAQEQLAAQAEIARQQLDNARQQQEAKEFLQNRALELLMEVGPLRQGDLTIRAKVTEDEIGTVADSYNATINSLRKIVTQVQEAASQVGSTAGSSEGSVQQLAGDALKQAEAVQNALNQIDEMTQSIQTVAQSAQAAEQAVQVASQTVHEGDEAMNRTVEGILAIRETVAETAKKVKQLGESSQKISKVVNLIGTFAAQTNLLALNASIEAARAGEEGRGFAVVADEVRSLARQSAKATAEIEELVASIQTETNEVVAAMEAGTQQVVSGTQLVEETRQSLNQIAEASDQISNLVQAIAKATVIQSQASNVVSETITDVAGIATNTSSRATEVLAAFQDLINVAKDLQGTVGRFKLS